MDFLWVITGILALACAVLVVLWLRAQQKLAVAEARAQSWQEVKAQSIEAAKAASLETVSAMSNKLLEDHKREAKTAREVVDQQMRKTTEGLMEHVKLMGEKLTALHTHHTENSKQVGTLWKALSTPAGAGKLNEIGLENSLKNLGLEPGRDFSMQYTLQDESGAKLRPDAVIFLPQDQILVVDCKASKALLELAESEDTVAYEAALKSFIQTMQKHVKDLASKDYRAAIQSFYKQTGRSGQISHIMCAMYLPHENNIDYIHRANPELIQQCEKMGLILAAPSHLKLLLTVAGSAIRLGKQEENQQRIIATVQELLDGIGQSFAHIEKLGRGIKTVADSFDQFARSANRFLLPKMHKIAQMGVKPTKAKELPTRVISYDVRVQEDTMLIEGEAETTPLKLVEPS